MTRSKTLSPVEGYCWLLLGLALLGCPNTDSNDTAPEGDTDTDADADTDSDTDTTDAYGTIVASVLDGEMTTFSLDEDFEESSTCRECRLEVDRQGNYPVYADRTDYVFGEKTIQVDAGGEFNAVWGEGQYGADFSGTCVEAEDSQHPGWEHEVQVAGTSESVKLGISRADGCQFGAEMTGHEFAYDDGDSYSCIGYGSAARDELFFDHSWTGGSYQVHCLFY